VSYLKTEINDRVAVIALSDPKRRNAMSIDMCAEVEETFDSLEADPDVGAIVVTGEGTSFCAGADLSKLDDDDYRGGLLDIYAGFLRVGSSPLPTIAAVNGHAVGAGMNLALIADLRLAGESARFDARFLQLGIHPGGGHTWMFRRIAGPQATFAADLFGEIMDGKEAERAGLVWRCVPDDQLLDEAVKLAGRAAAGPPELVRKIKATIVDQADITTQVAAMERELDPQVWSIGEPMFQKTLAKLRSGGPKKPTR